MLRKTIIPRRSDIGKVVQVNWVQDKIRYVAYGKLSPFNRNSREIEIVQEANIDGPYKVSYCELKYITSYWVFGRKALRK